ncbi:hypothetical protein DSO57_1019822 [Entomophthora muscae]|uniref:Uncharacterized protein n=1 Tax=Entomophthora muscae TaxID=34485 RepID=A0ACC2RV90_9FUNG|nr:hypothetical protein DSO57_1019822 [Entomophthora muscae]
MFALMMVLVTYLAFYAVVNSFLTISAANFSRSLVKNAPLRDIFISSISTYGIYLVSSILFLDPWHMVTSFLQYLLFMPSFVNIMMVYAFCNTHDISWGTKGEIGLEALSGNVQSQTNDQGIEVARVEVGANQISLNLEYEQVLQDLIHHSPESKEKADAKTIREDKNKRFRTCMVLAWVITNGLLIILLTSETLHSLFPSPISNPEKFNPYLTFVFWSITTISLVRFIGVLFYLMGSLIWG